MATTPLYTLVKSHELDAAADCDAALHLRSYTASRRGVAERVAEYQAMCADGLLPPCAAWFLTATAIMPMAEARAQRMGLVDNKREAVVGFARAMHEVLQEIGHPTPPEPPTHDEAAAFRHAFVDGRAWVVQWIAAGLN